METIKNNKNLSNNMMKKVLTIFSILFMFISVNSVYGFVLYEDDQEVTNINYDASSMIGTSTPSLLFNGGADITENFKLTTTPLYLLLSAGGGNDSETISISYYDGVFETFITENYNISSDDTFIIQLTPQNIGDTTSLILHNASGNVFYSYVFIHDELRDQTTTIFTPLISAVVELIDINITIWRAGFYLIIFLISVSLIIGLFGGSFWIIKNTKKINDDYDNHRRD